MTELETINLLVTVKAYPAISQKHGEVVCVAGIRTDGAAPEWVRLFPVPFRDLAFQDRFQKYQIISLRANPDAGSDSRPESWRPDADSIRAGAVIGAEKNWAKRKPYVMPLVIESMCALQRQQAIDQTSLGVFQPREVQDFTVERTADTWDETKQGVINQPSLFFPGKTGLEVIPYRFRYRYRCSDAKCRGHHQTIIDWELAQSYRSWLPKYGPTTVLTKLREKWLDTMWAADRDSYMYVGNQHLYPEAFLVLGVFWPKKEPA